MTNSYLTGHYNFLGILENLCQDLGTVHFHGQIWGAAHFIPAHCTSLTLMKKTISLLRQLSFCDKDISFQATLVSLRLFLYFDINSNIVPFLIDICRSWVKISFLCTTS